MRILTTLLFFFAIPLIEIAHATETLEIRYSGPIEIRDLEAGKPYLTNRKYLIKRIPRGLNDLKFTAIPGGALKDLQARIPAGATVYLALDSEKKIAGADSIREYSSTLEKEGWKYFGKIGVTDERMEYLRILVKTFHDEEIIEFKGVGFVGSILIAPSLELKGQ